MFDFQRHGHCAVFTGEDDVEECRERLFRIANQFGLSAAQRDELRRYVHVCPLAGVDATLVASDRAGNATKTDTYHRMLQFLKQTAEDGNFEYVFVAVDPLARFAGDSESNNHVATILVGMLEEVIQVTPGQPALGCTHHASQSSVREGQARSRGVTGLRNGVRAEFCMTLFVTDDGFEGLIFDHTKHNSTPRADPFWLVRCANKPLGNSQWLTIAGVLREATTDEAEQLDAVRGERSHATRAQRKQSKVIQNSSDFQVQCDLVLDLIPFEPDTTNEAELLRQYHQAGHTGNHHKLAEFIDTLNAGRKIKNTGTGQPRQPKLWTRPQPNGADKF